jgi:hypothetical protein
MSILKCTDEPAFPSGPSDTVVGMTLRDYFAAKAMAAFIIAYPRDSDAGTANAAIAYKQADAMLEYRQRSKS